MLFKRETMFMLWEISLIQNPYQWTIVHLHKIKDSIDSNCLISPILAPDSLFKVDWTEIEPVNWFDSKLRTNKPGIDVISAGILPVSSLLCKWSSCRVSIFPNCVGMTPVKRLSPVEYNHINKNERNTKKWTIMLHIIHT